MNLIEDKIKSLLLDPSENIIPQRSNERYLRNKGIYDIIDSKFDDSYTLGEKIFCITHNLKERKKM